MNGLQYGVDPLLSLWLGQDSLAGEDGMGDLPPGVSPLGRPQMLGPLPQSVVGSGRGALPSLYDALPDWLKVDPKRGGLNWSDQPTKLSDKPAGATLGAGQSETGISNRPIGDALKPIFNYLGQLVPKVKVGDVTVLGDNTPPFQSGPDQDPNTFIAPAVKAPIGPPAEKLPSDPATLAILELLRQEQPGGRAGGGVPSGVDVGGSADPQFAGDMRRRLAEYEQGNQPLTVPQQTSFDRSGIDKWLELATPKEPAKRTWQDMLMDIGIGMTIGGAQGGKGWAALGPILAGGAKGFQEGRQQDRQDRREFEQAQRQYAGQRAGVESDLEGQRVRRADELARLQLDVDRANKGDRLAQLKVGMEVDRAIEESRRGNASLALQKMQILSSNALGQARLRLAEQSNKIRLIGALARSQGGGMRGPTVDVGGIKLPISGLDDGQAVVSALPGMLNKGTVTSFLPVPVVERIRSAAIEQLSGEIKGAKGIPAVMPGSPAYDKRLNALMLPMLQAWLQSNDPEAQKRRASIASILRAQPTLMALGRDRESYRRGSPLDLLDEED